MTAKQKPFTRGKPGGTPGRPIVPPGTKTVPSKPAKK
jgi:hypothetical protein